MNHIQPIAFAFEDAAVRIIPNADKPLFVAKDVALALGYENPSKAINDHCKGVTIRYPLSTKGGQQEVRIIEEADVYRLIFGSKLESAKRFQDWVFEEVLPSIRKNGAYGTLKPADEIRYLNQRLQLLRELQKVREPLAREKVYEQFKFVSDRLGFDTPALAAFPVPTGNENLDESTQATLQQFFQAIATLESLDIAVNHHSNPALLAVNLKALVQVCADNGVALPTRLELLRALPQSLEPKFLGASVVIASVFEKNKQGEQKSVRCYVFRKRFKNAR